MKQQACLTPMRYIYNSGYDSKDREQLILLSQKCFENNITVQITKGTYSREDWFDLLGPAFLKTLENVIGKRRIEEVQGM